MAENESMIVKRPKMVNIEPDEEFWESDIVSAWDIIELKYDGIWGQLEAGSDGYRIWSRNGKLKEHGKGNFPPIHAHGEYMFGSQWARESAFYKELRLFDVESVGFDVTHLPLMNRRQGFLQWKESARRRALDNDDADALDFLARAHIVGQYDNTPEALGGMWKLMVENEGYEGLVLKNKRGEWMETWGRIKHKPTMDYVCIGFEPGGVGTKYEGLVCAVRGALHIGDELKYVCRVGGLTESQRMAFATNPERYIGHVFEANGKKVFKSGALRHPNFVRWRDDKEAVECTM